MLYIAHDMGPFSPDDVTIFSNCDSVKLFFLEEDSMVVANARRGYNMPHGPMVFPNMYNFQRVKAAHRKAKFATASLRAVGYIDGRVAANGQRFMSEALEKIVLVPDNEGMALIADGADIVPVVAYCTDKYGTIKTLNHRFIVFEVEGEGELVGGDIYGVNPQKMVAGTAVALVRASHRPGVIKIKASCLFDGVKQPAPAQIEIQTIAPHFTCNFSESPNYFSGQSNPTIQTNLIKAQNYDSLKTELELLKVKYNSIKAIEVEKQQEKFEHKE